MVQYGLESSFALVPLFQRPYVDIQLKQKRWDGEKILEDAKVVGNLRN